MKRDSKTLKIAAPLAVLAVILLLGAILPALFLDWSEIPDRTDAVDSALRFGFGGGFLAALAGVTALLAVRSLRGTPLKPQIPALIFPVATFAAVAMAAGWWGSALVFGLGAGVLEFIRRATEEAPSES